MAHMCMSFMTIKPDNKNIWNNYSSYSW